MGKIGSTKKLRFLRGRVMGGMSGYVPSLTDVGIRNIRASTKKGVL